MSKQDSASVRPRAYQADLAYVHDVGFGSFAEGCAPGLLRILSQAGIREGRVVDLGCGSGIWARHLVDARYDVTGVDISPDMLALARHRTPEADLCVASFLEFEFPPCRVITALGEVLCYQFDARNNRRALRRLFRRAHDALETGGVLICDIAEVGLDRNRAPSAREGAGWACHVRYEYDSKRDQLVRYISAFCQDGVLYRRHDEVHRVQLYQRGDVSEMLSAAGFRVRVVQRYGDYELLPGRVGFVARKGRG